MRQLCTDKLKIMIQYYKLMALRLLEVAYY